MNAGNCQKSGPVAWATPSNRWAAATVPSGKNGRMNGERPVLVVDAANVVGSRPDGWWRDRHGATLRLRDALVPLTQAYQIILVVEGKARGVPPTADIEVVAAPGAGDDEIV